MSTDPDLDLFITDLNGSLRGKRLPGEALSSALAGTVKLPLSVVGLDIWGDDVHDNGLVFETGDSDGRLMPVNATPLPVPWLTAPRRQMLAWLFNPDGSPFGADPRQVLDRVLKRCALLQLTPMVATELEFYLLDGESEAQLEPTPPIPADGKRRRLTSTDCYSIDHLDGLDAVLGDIRKACSEQGIAADSIIAEYGPGQFEVNLHHAPDALSLGDQSILFRRLVRGVAHAHGYGATFMAKPYSERAGSGFHVHVSLLNAAGDNAFDDGHDQGGDLFRHAIGGLVERSPELMLIFAPHLNSWRRFVERSHAPLVADWGWDNRMSAVRVPAGGPSNRRLEHRIAGADANPYLVLAAILAGMCDGILREVEPPPPSNGETPVSEMPERFRLPRSWSDAVDRFEQSAFAREWLGEQFTDVFVAAKRQEMRRFGLMISDLEYDAYLGRL